MIESRTPVPGRRACHLAAATVFAAILAGCAASKGPLLLHPAPPTLEKYSLSQGAIVFSGPDFSVSVRPWDYRLIAEEFRLSGEPCPFGDNDAEVGRFLFFRVLLDNRSSRTLVFNPMRASLQSPGEGPEMPLDYPDLLAFSEDDRTGAEARGRAFRRTCFDLTATIRPGQSLERYLVFRSPAEPAKRIGLDLDDLWLDTKSQDLKFFFETFPGK